MPQANSTTAEDIGHDSQNDCTRNPSRFVVVSPRINRKAEFDGVYLDASIMTWIGHEHENRKFKPTQNTCHQNILLNIINKCNASLSCFALT